MTEIAPVAGNDTIKVGGVQDTESRPSKNPVADVTELLRAEGAFGDKKPKSKPKDTSSTEKPDEVEQSKSENDDGQANDNTGEGQDEKETESKKAKPKDKKPEGDDGQSDEESEITWAKVLGLNDDDVVLDDEGNFKAVKITINGKTEEVALNKMRNGFQFEEYTRRKSEEVAEDKRNFDKTRKEVVDLYQAKVNENAQVAKFLMNELISEYEGIDWDALRYNDPQAYAQHYPRFIERQEKVANIYNQVLAESQQVEAHRQMLEQQQKEVAIRENMEKLVNKHPEWVDVNKMKADFEAFREGIKLYDFTPQDFDTVIDYRHIEILKDALAYRKSLEEGKSKVVTANAPKYMKSSGTAKKPVSKLDQLMKAAKSAQGHSQKGAQIAFVDELLRSTGN